ncbi:MAG TPA: AAA family ATPase [Alphaproteobacteria bacterium]
MNEHVTPLTQPHLFGHNDVLQKWQERFTQDNFHHGLILSGPKGVGKATLVFHFAKWLLSQGKSPAQISRQIEAGSHPGIKIIERLFDEKRQRYYGGITIEAVQPIFEFLRLSQIDDGYRVIIIDGADTMNRHAQNSILKLLEEPPKKTFFFLLVEQAGLLLPTIRSRALVQSLAPLSQGDFTHGLQTLLPDMDGAQTQAYFALTHGVLGQAIEWHEQEILGIYETTLEAALKLGEGNEQPAMKWAETYAPVAQEMLYEMIRQLILKRMSDIIRQYHLNQGFQPLVPDEEKLYNHWIRLPATQLISAYDTMQSLFDRTEYSHLDRKLALLQALQLFSGQGHTVAPQRVNR